MPLVSVCMAVRNGGPGLVSAVRSILRQSLNDWELIIVDDASSDGALEAVRAFNDPRIFIKRNSSNLGLAASLNLGLDRAQGHYFARMDADDVSFADRFTLQVNFLNTHPQIDVLGGQAVVFQGDWRLTGKLQVPCGHDEIVARAHMGIPLIHPCWMGRIDWFRKHRYDESFLRAQDYELLLRALPESRYANLPEVVLGYRYEDQNVAKRLVTRRFFRRALSKNLPRSNPDYWRALARLAAKNLADRATSALRIEGWLNRRRFPLVASSVEVDWAELVRAVR